MFAVAQERPKTPAKFTYKTAEAANEVARRFVTGRGGEIAIWQALDPNLVARPVEIAIVLKDALDRVWTQVNACPGQQAWL